MEVIRKVLSPREYQILVLRYGIGGGPELTQKEVAKKFGISRSYVSRIEKKLWTKSAKRLRTNFERFNLYFLKDCRECEGTSLARQNACVLPMRERALCLIENEVTAAATVTAYTAAV